MASEFEIHRTNSGGYYWLLQADNNEKLCHSEDLTSKANAEKAIAAVKRLAKDAPIRDRT